LKYQLNDKISKCEGLLEKKDDLDEEKGGKKILELKKV